MPHDVAKLSISIQSLLAGIATPPKFGNQSIHPAIIAHAWSDGLRVVSSINDSDLGLSAHQRLAHHTSEIFKLLGLLKSSMEDTVQGLAHTPAWQLSHHGVSLSLMLMPSKSLAGVSEQQKPRASASMLLLMPISGQSPSTSIEHLLDIAPRLQGLGEGQMWRISSPKYAIREASPP